MSLTAMQVLVAELSAMPSRPYDAQGAAGLAEAMRLIVLRDTGTQEAIGSSDVFDVQSKAG
jgi:hypothetical protein